MLTGSEVLDLVLKELRIKINPFAKSLNINAQGLYDIRAGVVKSISKNLALKITSAYPQFNTAWLLTGEGEMLNRVEIDEEKKDDPATSLDIKKETEGTHDSSLAALIESNKLLIQSQLNYSESHRVLAESHKIQSEALLKQVNNNTDLINRHGKETTANSFLEIDPAWKATIQAFLDILSEVASGKIYHSKDEAKAALNIQIGESLKKITLGDTVAVGHSGHKVST